MRSVKQSSTIVETDPLPGESPALPDETSELPGETSELPVETYEVPGEAPELPGETGELSGEALELPGETPEETPVDLPLSLGVVGYAAFALLQPIPLSEIVPFPTVVSAFEAEAALLSTPEPAAPPVPEPEPEPESEREHVGVAPGWSPEIPLTTSSEPAVAYTEGGYRPASGATWTEEFVHSAQATSPDPADDPALEVDGQVQSKPVTLIGQQFAAGGYAANSPSGDSQARKVLDELSFLFDK